MRGLTPSGVFEIYPLPPLKKMAIYTSPNYKSFIFIFTKRQKIYTINEIEIPRGGMIGMEWNKFNPCNAIQVRTLVPVPVNGHERIKSYNSFTGADPKAHG